METCFDTLNKHVTYKEFNHFYKYTTLPECYKNFLNNKFDFINKELIEELNCYNKIKNDNFILDMSEINFVDNITVLEMYFSCEHGLFLLKFSIHQEYIDEMFGSLIHYMGDLNDVVNYIFVNYLHDSGQGEIANNFCIMNNVSDVLASYFSITVEKLNKGYMLRMLKKFEKYDKKIKNVHANNFMDILSFYLKK